MKAGTTDIDPDGVWLQTLSATRQCGGVFWRVERRITGGNPSSNSCQTAPGPACPPAGDANHKVDGSTTARADAGEDQDGGCPGATVTLDGQWYVVHYTGKPRHSPTQWTQTSGDTTVTPEQYATAQNPTFTAPSFRTDLEFTLVVNDGTNPSAPDTVAVAVRPPAPALVDVGGGCTQLHRCPPAPTGTAGPGPGVGQITANWTPGATAFVT